MSDSTWDSESIIGAPTVTKNDRFASILVILVAVVGFAVGLALRQNNLNQTWRYVNREAGIEASYPAGWLVDENGPYVARIRDPKARPFKTQYIITIMPAGGQTSVRNILDSLTVQRSTDLPAYRVLSVEEQTSSGVKITHMNFAFVEADPSPYIQRLPVVVLGTDLVVLDGQRVIVVTFMADQDSFDRNLPNFQRFFASLTY